MRGKEESRLENLEEEGGGGASEGLWPSFSKHHHLWPVGATLLCVIKDEEEPHLLALDLSGVPFMSFSTNQFAFTTLD